MAMTKCPECQRSISDLAKSCPACGYPLACPPNDGEAAFSKSDAACSSIPPTCGDGIPASQGRPPRGRVSASVECVVAVLFVVPVVLAMLATWASPGSAASSLPSSGVEWATFWIFGLICFFALIRLWKSARNLLSKSTRVPAWAWVGAMLLAPSMAFQGVRFAMGGAGERSVSPSAPSQRLATPAPLPSASSLVPEVRDLLKTGIESQVHASVKILSCDLVHKAGREYTGFAWAQGEDGSKQQFELNVVVGDDGKYIAKWQAIGAPAGE